MEAGDQEEFKVILYYIVGLRPARVTLNPVSKEIQNKQTEITLITLPTLYFQGCTHLHLY